MHCTQRSCHIFSTESCCCGQSKQENQKVCTTLGQTETKKQDKKYSFTVETRFECEAEIAFGIGGYRNEWNYYDFTSLNLFLLK